MTVLTHAKAGRVVEVDGGCKAKPLAARADAACHLQGQDRAARWLGIVAGTAAAGTNGLVS